MQPKMINRYNEIPIKLPLAFFTGIEKKILKFIWNHKTPPNSQNKVEKNKTGDIVKPNFKLYYRVKIMKAIWHQHKNGIRITVTESGAQK